jgi:non-specific serine/threonine protein kinase
LSSPAPADGSARPLRFGPGGRFELQPAEYRLLVDGQPAALGGRALDLLIALAARPAQLITKNELLDIVWPGLVVEENNLRVQVNALRRLLGEGAIATVPGRGYRLSVSLRSDAPTAGVAPPAVGASPASAPALASTPTPTPTPTPARSDDGANLSAAPCRPGPRLFGRAADLARLDSLLLPGGAHCVTLVGTAGVGKSSLARAALARWRGPAAWVDLALLAPRASAAEVAAALARALGVQLDETDPAPQLLRALPATQTLLLVLDNAEHLVEASAHWARQLAPVPRLRLLLTSQVPLGVAAEQVQRLAPLALDDGDGDDGEHAGATEGALAMLVERIVAADSRYMVTPAARPLLAALCRQLDGLPLALEMAAARVPLMGLKAVHDALAERFALLARGRRDAPARHRTLHDALDWSVQLLAADEQRLFRALGVFAGGFTLEMALSLTSDEHVDRWHTVDGLATLVERSLINVSGEDPPRYGLLETLRAYAREQAAAHGEMASLRQRHAAAVWALLAHPESEALCLAEMENVREAFVWAREHELAAAAQLSARAAGLTGFTVWRNEVSEWMLSLQPAMQQAAGRALAPPAQAAWWSMLAYVLNVRRDPAASAAARAAVALWQQIGDAAELQSALGHWVRSIKAAGRELDEACAALLASSVADPGSPRAQLRVYGALAEAARLRGDTQALLACREQELRAARELGWQDMAQAAETNVCAALIELGRAAEAAQRAQALLARIDAGDAGDARHNGNLPWALNVRLESLLALRRFDEAQALVPRSLAAGRRFGTSVAWQGILTLLTLQQRHAAAARLIGHVARLWSERSDTPDIDERGRLAQAQAAVCAALGEPAAQALAAEGRLLGDAAAQALVMQDDAAAAPAAPPTPPPTA